MILLAPVTVLLGAWSFQDGEEKVTIKGEDVPLLTVFKSIKKQAGYNFFYAANFVNDKERVSVNMQNARVDDVLRKVLGHDYTWVYNENAVSITKKKAEVRRSSPPAAPVKDSSVNQITVSGSVTDAKGTPIPGATVMVKGTHDGASTDENGHFSLAGVRPNAVLVISSVGFEKREVPVKGKTIWAKLNVSVNDLDEAVVVAYGETTQRANTGAVTVVRGEQIQNLPNRSFDRSLQGQVPGLLVTSGNGQPGGGLSNIVLRGIGTGTNAGFGSTVRNPLIIIDGIPVTQDYIQSKIADETPISNPIAQLNPGNIESISVLKDAAAIALYGSKASNGVILITTKKGRSGATQVSFRHQTDIASRLKAKMEVLSQVEYLQLLKDSYRNSDPLVWTEDAIMRDLESKFPTIENEFGDTIFYPEPNWFDELYNKHAVTISNELSFSGGSEKTTYYLNFEYTTQNGIVKTTGYDRASVRYNFENQSKSWLKVGMNTTFSYNKQNYAGYSEAINQTISLPYILSPLNPVRLNNGEYYLTYNYGTPYPSAYPVSNPVASAEYNINRITSYRGLGKAYAELNFMKHFKFYSSLGIDFMLSESKEKIDPRLSFGTLRPGTGSIEEKNIRRISLITTNILKYSQAHANGHNIGVVAGQEAQAFYNKFINVSGQGLRIPSFDQISAAKTIVSAAGNVGEETLLSYFSQLNYDYRGKYFISVSGRRDGSSKFGSRTRYGNYWSTGAGWVVSEENFINETAKWLTYLKLRGSLGTSGNSAVVSPITRFDALYLNAYAGNNAVQTTSSPGNEDIQWEETFNTDIGVEARVLNERIGFTADVYRRRISNLIYSTRLSPVTGYRDVLDNIGDMENKGVELSLSIDVIRKKDFRWGLSLNWSTNKNKLLKANIPLSATGNLVNKERESFNSFYLVRWAGVNSANGKPQWFDSAGKVTESYDLNNRVIVGKPQPDGFGGVTSSLSYKDLEFTCFFYYQYGFQIYDNTLAFLLNDGAAGAVPPPYINQVRSALDYWKKPGDLTANPRRILNNTDKGNMASTRYLFDGDFIRLKTVTLAYTLPSDILRKIGLSNARVYIQGHNLLTWTAFPGMDPEGTSSSGNAGFSYPQQRSLSFGLNLGF